jgi:hypothetical protein
MEPAANVSHTHAFLRIFFVTMPPPFYPIKTNAKKY